MYQLLYFGTSRFNVQKRSLFGMNCLQNLQRQLKVPIEMNFMLPCPNTYSAKFSSAKLMEMLYFSPSASQDHVVFLLSK